ncbi:MAG: hypothetical protein IPL27_21265 [Lewinellaceae bacterium]|nr:hypothetical protein [Lewinellaceae bacterium]
MDPTKPQGAFSVSKNGTFVEQNGTGSKGVAQLGTEDQFCGSDFAQFARDGRLSLLIRAMVIQPSA